MQKSKAYISSCPHPTNELKNPINKLCNFRYSDKNTTDKRRLKLSVFEPLYRLLLFPIYTKLRSNIYKLS